MKSFMKEVRRLFSLNKKSSVFRINWLAISACLLAPMILLIAFIFIFLNGILHEDVDKKCNQQAQICAKSVSQIISSTTTLFDLLSAQPFTSALRMTKEIDTLWYPHLLNIQQTQSFLQYAISLDIQVDQIIMYYSEPRRVFDTKHGSSSLQSYSERNVIEHIMEEPYRSYCFINDNLYLYKYHSSSFGKYNPVLFIVKFNHSSTKSILTSYLEQEALEEIYLIISDRVIPMLSCGNISDDAFLLAQKSPTHNHSMFYANVQGNIHCALAYDTRALYQNVIIELITIILPIFLILSVGSLFVALIIAERITKPINTLANHLSDSNNHNADQAVLRKYIELQSISNAYEEVIDENTLLRMSLEEKQELLRQAQIAALEYQVHPHMIYNALDSFNWAIRKQIGLVNPISDAIMRLSDLMRFGLKNAGQLILIQHEIEQLNNYILLQQFQHSEKIKIIWEFADALKHYQIIKLSLQPLVENALKYAYSSCENPKLWIIGFIENNCINIRIKDNGKGFSEQALKALRSHLQTPRLTSVQHIGLSNVHLRYQLQFGTEYGITVSSKAGEYTCVDLLYPAIEQSDLP